MTPGEILHVMEYGRQCDEDMKRELAKTNYLNIRDRRSKKERYKHA